MPERSEATTLRASRRHFLRTLLVVPETLILTACVVAPPPSRGPAGPAVESPTATPILESSPAAQTLVPTPACADDDEPTPAQTAGPFYTPNTPQRTSLRESGIEGALLRLTGLVVTPDCRPIGGALLDFWHADNAGAYDNAGYKLRGHQFADAAGAYRLETIVPGLYPGRTRHIHVRVQAPDGPILTTQLYFPDEPANARDIIFRPDLLMDVVDGEEEKAATFTFVLG